MGKGKRQKAKGKRQADKNGRPLNKHGCLERLCASPSGRKLETAYTVNAYAQAELMTREELMKRDMGDWSRLILVTHGVMSKAILTFYLGLRPQPVHRLRRRNNLAYRLTFHANAIETHYFLDGTEACEGLYRLQ